MFRKIAPVALLAILATGVGYATVELMPAPGTAHTATVAPTPARDSEPIARPAMPVPATEALPNASEPQLGPSGQPDAPNAPEGTDAGQITHAAGPLPTGAQPPVAAPAPAPVASGPSCLRDCTPTCGPGEEPQGEFGCVAVQLPEEQIGRVYTTDDGRICQVTSVSPYEEECAMPSD